MQDIRTYVLGPSLIFPYFSSTFPILNALLTHNERFFYLFCLIILTIIVYIICFIFIKRNNTLLIYTISLILIVSAFCLQRSYEARQGLLLKESIFSKPQYFQPEIIETNTNSNQLNKGTEYFKTFEEFKTNLMNEFEQKSNLDISIKKYFIDLGIKRKEIAELIKKLEENWNSFLKESYNISKELQALDVSIELYNLELQEFLQNVSLKYIVLNGKDIASILIPTSHTKLLLKQMDASNHALTHEDNAFNAKNGVVIKFIIHLIVFFCIQLLICFIAFFLDSNLEKIQYWIRSSLFMLSLFGIFLGLICMIYAHTGERLCLSHDLNSCKTDSAQRIDDIINIVNGNKNETSDLVEKKNPQKIQIGKQSPSVGLSNKWFSAFNFEKLLSFTTFALPPSDYKQAETRVKNANINTEIKNAASLQQIEFIKTEFQTHREQIQKIIGLLKESINNELKDKLFGKQILFDNLFDKIKYLEPEFDNLMKNRVNKEHYYNLIQSIKSEISSIVLISSQRGANLLSNLIEYVKMDEFFKNSLDSLKMYIAGSSIVNQEKFKIENEKCRNSIKLVCNGASRLNELYLIMLGFGCISGIMLCF
ncbi:hypothetical protein CDIK_0408 [Cucumispora dikerogammari]|nr:hypothetical protein CDIK_0408 [Cucumispora dikerogammari]